MLTAGCYAPVDIPPPHPHPGYDDGVIHTERMPKLSPMCSVQSVTHVPCRSGPPQGTGSDADSTTRLRLATARCWWRWLSRRATLARTYGAQVSRVSEPGGWGTQKWHYPAPILGLPRKGGS